jgi:hypothetical protein
LWHLPLLLRPYVVSQERLLPRSKKRLKRQPKAQNQSATISIPASGRFMKFTSILVATWQPYSRAIAASAGSTPTSVIDGRGCKRSRMNRVSLLNNMYEIRKQRTIL